MLMTDAVDKSIRFVTNILIPIKSGRSWVINFSISFTVSHNDRPLWDVWTVQFHKPSSLAQGGLFWPTTVLYRCKWLIIWTLSKRYSPKICPKVAHMCHISAFYCGYSNLGCFACLMRILLFGNSVKNILFLDHTCKYKGVNIFRAHIKNPMSWAILSQGLYWIYRTWYDRNLVWHNDGF